MVPGTPAHRDALLVHERERPAHAAVAADDHQRVRARRAQVLRRAGAPLGLHEGRTACRAEACPAVRGARVEVRALEREDAVVEQTRVAIHDGQQLRTGRLGHTTDGANAGVHAG
jgi:hypothetical protein